MKRCYLLIPLFLLIYFNNYSQDFGEVPDELLKMTSLAEDPEEDAAIIFDKCTVKITSDFYLETKRHVRVKVFTEEGKKQANIKIVTWHEDDLSGIDAISISPDGKEYELDSDNIFEEEGEKTNTTSFPIPGIEVGSVFDYEYKIYSKYISHLEPWTFQTGIFTKYSELNVYLKEGFTYRKLAMNLELYDLQEKYEQITDRDDIRKKIGIFTWSCSNLPGVKDEPFTDNIDKNFARLYFIMLGYKSQYVNLSFAQDWDYVGKNIYKSYDNLINDDDTKEVVEKLVKNESNEINKAKLIYDYIRTNIKSTDHKGLFGDYLKSPVDVIKEKTGSTSDKSMLLINMLTQAGLNAKPLWVSTRSNGEIITFFCDQSQFNRLICLLQIGTDKYFLYPASLNLPFGYLTSNVDVDEGLLIEKENGTIITINSQKLRNSLLINTTGNIDSTNTLKANTHFIYNGLAAFSERDALTEKDAESYVRDYLKDKFNEAKLDSFRYSDIDSVYKPLELNLYFTIENYLQETDQLSYFSLPFFTGLKENPFIKDRRSNPIDFEYPILKNEVIRIDFPEKYVVSEVPARTKKFTTNLGYNLVYAPGKNYVECNRTYDLGARRLDKKKYSDIKTIYNNIVSSSTDQIVLTKKSTVELNK